MKSPIHKISLALLAVAPAFFFFSCKSDKSTADNTRRAVAPPLTSNIPFRDFDIDANAADTIKLSEGTNIILPGGTFVDAAGAPVKGKVQLHYRAFYTPGEIVTSGIMMNYDTAGVSHIFTSAGMFELTGTQFGKPIAIAKGKNIKMNFASTRNDAEVNFYNLDTTAKQWNFLATTKADTNFIRKKLMEELSRVNVKPVEPKAFDATKPVIDVDVDQNDHPELAGYNGIVWQYAGKGLDPEQNKWIYSTNWTTVKMREEDSTACTYKMTLSNATQSFSTNVVPALKGNDYKNAVANFKEKMDAFNAKEIQRISKLQTASQMPAFRRDVIVPVFGIHNCDMFRIFGIPAYVKSEFHFDDAEFEKHRENVTVMMINDRGRIVTSFSGDAIPDITYLSDKENCIIAVLRGTTKAAVLNNKEFSQAVYSSHDGPVKFKLHSTSKALAVSSDLDELIADL